MKVLLTLHNMQNHWWMICLFWFSAKRPLSSDSKTTERCSFSWLPALRSSSASLRFVCSWWPSGSNIWRYWEVAQRKDFTPSLGNPPDLPQWAFSRGEPEQNYTCNVLLRGAFHTHSVLESVIITTPNYYLNVCHIELRSLQINKRRPEQMCCITNSLIPHKSTAASALRRFSSFQVFKSRDRGINGNLLLLMNRS